MREPDRAAGPALPQMARRHERREGAGREERVEFCMALLVWTLFFLFVTFWGWEWSVNSESEGPPFSPWCWALLGQSGKKRNQRHPGWKGGRRALCLQVT